MTAPGKQRHRSMYHHGMISMLVAGVLMVVVTLGAVTQDTETEIVVALLASSATLLVLSGAFAWLESNTGVLQ